MIGSWCNLPPTLQCAVQGTLVIVPSECLHQRNAGKICVHGITPHARLAGSPPELPVPLPAGASLRKMKLALWGLQDRHPGDPQATVGGGHRAPQVQALAHWLLHTTQGVPQDIKPHLIPERTVRGRNSVLGFLFLHGGTGGMLGVHPDPGHGLQSLW